MIQTLLSTECKPSWTIVEIGTWNGLGSTLCVLQGLQGRQHASFLSLECNKEKHEAALENLEDYLTPTTQLLWGSIVTPQEVTTSEYLANFSGLVQEWFKADIENCAVAPNLLSSLPSQIDFLLLDGGEYTTLREFELLVPRCTNYIALDDVLIDKCRRVRDSLLSHPDWTEVFMTRNRNGFSVFQRRHPTVQ